jgi:hypothetical protein
MRTDLLCKDKATYNKKQIIFTNQQIMRREILPVWSPSNQRLHELGLTL